jgi:uncharacterized protein YrrD
MLRSVENDLKGLSLQATDGDVGTIDDVYFDDEKWAVRYFVVNTGNWLMRDYVLISPMAVRGETWNGEAIPVALTKEQVENSPDISTDEPVARQHEREFANYYGWPYYWVGPYTWGAWASPAAIAYAPPSVETEEQRTEDVEEEGDPHLRSASNVNGYRIHARDEEIGHVADFLVEEETWKVRYMIVDTSNWWFGKKVLIAPEWIERIEWDGSLVYVDLTVEQIKSGPEWDPNQPVAEAYEDKLHRHYDRKPTYRRAS